MPPPPADGSIMISLRHISTVLIIDRGSGAVTWKLGPPLIAQQHAPNELPNGNILIFDNGAHRQDHPLPHSRVIEVDRFTKDIVWSYGPTSGPGALNNPNSAELLSNGHVLIADENNNRVIEITRSGHIVWQYGSGVPTVTTPIQFAAFASRLPNGDTLITDSGHSRIVEVTKDKAVVSEG